VWKNPSPNLSSGGWARNFSITPLTRWWPGFTPATRNCFPCRRPFRNFYALEQRYRSLFLGQFLGARERKRSGEVSKQKREEVFLRRRLASAH
jgi:hypothetical protein